MPETSRWNTCDSCQTASRTHWELDKIFCCKPKKAMEIISLANKSFFILKEIALDLKRGRPKTILFSHSPWKASLLRFHKLYKHQFIFADLSHQEFGFDFDFVIPLDRKSYFHAIGNNAISRAKLIAPNLETFELCNDKRRLNEELLGSHFKEMIPSNGANQLPLIIKPRTGANSEKCQLIKTREDLLANEALLQSADYLVSEMIPGSKEYALHILFDNNQIVRHLCIEYEFNEIYPIKTYNAPIAKRIVGERFNPIWVELLQFINYSGLCCINYKIVDGVPKLIEINPRLGGSMCEYFFAWVRNLN